LKCIGLPKKFEFNAHIIEAKEDNQLIKAKAAMARF